MIDDDLRSINANSSRQIRLGAAMSYIAILFSIVAGLIYTPWMISKIGRSDFALFSLVGAFLSYFVMDFGLSAGIARFISKYRAEQREKEVAELLGLTTKLYIVIGFVILIILTILFFFLEDIFLKLNSEEIKKFKVVFCIAGAFSVVSFPFLPLNSVTHCPST